ncbi:aminotransferase, variant [Capsaspora owczarzaki ATCC 30864]|uniref:Aminotransferase, variant n=1 Tax=Capsaspora owczarzaki (strain ATCC 30864) TaxID=595528 RepID=A0A0D2X196_CAPO3|nr:aminotransferase, variant [Capsaspora owczarzaki ATCC 30864]
MYGCMGVCACCVSDCFSLEAYGVATTALTSQPGTAPTVDEITAALSAAGSSHFSLVTLTHVDTSSGVLTDIKACAAAIRAAQPNALIAVDGVCSIGGEELRMDEWGVDVAFTASQKAIGCPAGLALMVLGERAMAAFNDRVARKVPVTGWYASLANWLPIMKAYEARQPSYFATPAVNLIVALHKALDNLVGFPGGLSALFARQVLASDAFKAGIAAMGLTLVPKTHASAAHLLSAIRFPQGVGAGDLVPKVRARGAVITGGLLAPIKTEYFRVGHMGVSALQASRDDLLVTLRAIEGALIELGVAGVTAGAAEAAFNSVLRK